MSTRWPRKIFGVTIVYIRDHVARKVTTVVPSGCSVWALLPGGEIGTNDAEFFKWACREDSREGVHLAERLWRLGKMSKSAYRKLADAQAAKQKRKSLKEAAHEFAHLARASHISLTASQLAQLKKLGVEPKAPIT
jgi:hypothetical protein